MKCFVPFMFSLLVITVWGVFSQPGLAQTTLFNGVEVPGVVINHYPESTGKYIGSPSLAILADGTYVASHDTFGPNGLGQVNVFTSTDEGLTWTLKSTINNQYWSGLFVYNNDLYILGTSKGHGDLIVRKSTNGGANWTNPTDGSNGLLLECTDTLGYHTSAVPVIVQNGRIWRAYEDNGAGGANQRKYRITMMSAPIESDLLDASSWTHTNTLTRESDWLPGFDFQGWIEGNAVVDRDGNVVNILRVDVGPGDDEKAAIARIASETELTFDPENDIIDMPGGAKKFTIRYHQPSDKYWAITSIVNEDNYDPEVKPSDIRNILALISSDDLRDWDVEQIILQDLSDVESIGFQYADWQFDGTDIVLVSRTAYPDGLGGADNYHNANFLTFHRVEDVLPLSIPGDLDGDGYVGLADLDIILSNWNMYVLPGDERADPSGNKHVGLGDLDIVLNNWNAGTPPQTTLTIPEPASGVVFMLCMLVSHRRTTHRLARLL